VPDLIVVTGPPGAGKTTLAQHLVSRYDPSALVSGDDFFKFIKTGYLDPWRPEAHEQNNIVTRASASATGRLVAGGFTVVYDGVLGPWFLDAFLTEAGVDRCHYAVLLPPEDIAIARVGSRSGHGFTDHDAARHMYRAFAQADIDSRHVITSTTGPADLAEILSIKVAGGSLVRERLD
jgi:cytidylate kinase